MKKLAAVFFLLLLGSWVVAEEARHDFSAARKENEKFYLQGRTEPYSGILFSLHENGKLKQEFHLKEGRFIGVGKSWYPDGTLMDETTFNELGQMEGEAIGYYPNGKVKVRCHFSSGKLNGSNNLFFEDGKPKVSGTMKDGTWDGETKAWWPNGNPKSSISYLEGRKHGLCREWHENGQPEFEGHLENDQPTGEQKSWHANGKPASVVVFENGRLVRDQQWNERGEPDFRRQCFALQRVIVSGLAMYEEEKGLRSGSATSTPDLDELVRLGILRQKPECPDRGLFSIEGARVKCSVHGLRPED